MSREANLAANERLGELVSTGDLNALGEVFADDVVDHDPAPDQGPGVDGFKAFFTAMRTGFPDLKVAPATVVADDEQVAMPYTITGTHEGEFQGIEPTGKRIEARGVQVARFRDGKIVERWGSSDELGLVGQLGMEPQPAQS